MRGGKRQEIVCCDEERGREREPQMKETKQGNRKGKITSHLFSPEARAAVSWILRHKLHSGRSQYVRRY